MAKLSRFIAGISLGALIGAVAGLLMAPTPGPEMKEHFQRRLDEALEVGKRVAAQREAELMAEFERRARG
ncbi:MAG TPA: hypothetical protein G4O02_02870 [Caldilineae bacterium]|jgi:gas vesicle protein|nr:hypothetical protein [Caldilineae bacterium]